MSERLYFKEARPESPLVADLPWANRILSAISSGGEAPILPPTEQRGVFLLEKGPVRGYWTHHLVDAPTLWQAIPEAEVPSVYVGVVLAASEQLWRASRLLECPPRLQLSQEELVERAWIVALSRRAQAGGLCALARSGFVTIIHAAMSRGIANDSAAHGDLHPGNILLSEGRPLVVDLENLQPAPAYSDLIYASVWARHVPAIWNEALARHEGLVGRPIDVSDFALGLSIMLVQAEETDAHSSQDLWDGVHWLLHQQLTMSFTGFGNLETQVSCAWASWTRDLVP